MSTVFGFILVIGCLFLIGYLGYGIVQDIKNRKKIRKIMKKGVKLDGWHFDGNHYDFGWWYQRCC